MSRRNYKQTSFTIFCMRYTCLRMRLQCQNTCISAYLPTFYRNYVATLPLSVICHSKYVVQSDYCLLLNVHRVPIIFFACFLVKIRYLHVHFYLLPTESIWQHCSYLPFPLLEIHVKRLVQSYCSLLLKIHRVSVVFCFVLFIRIGIT